MVVTKKAWVTLLTRSSYLAGCLVLNDSLVRSGSRFPLVVFCTDTLPEDARQVLVKAGIELREIEPLHPREKAKFDDHDSRFEDTWTKLRCLELVEYERIVMLDSDMIVMQNMDELMDVELANDEIAAVHACTCNPRKLPHYPKDWIPENCAHTMANKTTPLDRSMFTKPTHNSLNSGLVIAHPSHALFQKVEEVLQTDPIVHTFIFPDQDLLAHVFKGKFVPLGYQYNALKTLRNCHPEMWRDEDVKNVHYIIDKPWDAPRLTDENDQYYVVNQWWWDGFESLEREWLSKGMKSDWNTVKRSLKLFNPALNGGKSNGHH